MNRMFEFVSVCLGRYAQEPSNRKSHALFSEIPDPMNTLPDQAELCYIFVDLYK